MVKATAPTTEPTESQTPEQVVAQVDSMLQVDNQEQAVPMVPAETPDDAETIAAVDDIVAEESDTVLEAEDDQVAEAAEVSPELVSDDAGGLKHHPIFWFIIVLLAIFAIFSAIALSYPNLLN